MMFPVTITPEAVKAAKQKLQARGGGAVRLGIKGGGCSGFQYVVVFDDHEANDGDHVITQGDVTFLVDKKSALYLSGSIFDWVEHGLVSRGFEFKNPNVASQCGCGSSFSVK